MRATMKEMEDMRAHIRELKEMNKLLMDQLKRSNDSGQQVGSTGVRKIESFPSSKTASVTVATAKTYRNTKKNSSDYKVPIEKFEGTELYPGLGGNFREWGENFIMELITIQESMGMEWSESLKI